MINGKRVVVVLPAYNAASTLKKTYEEIPKDVVDDVILVDDASRDTTLDVANQIGISCIVAHKKNLGYGGNQKTCYNTALKRGADIVIMLHPDYQYTPKLITAMASLIGCGLYHVVFGSRILGTGALRGGMPPYKFVANRLLTLFQNTMMRRKLSEYHTGYRAFSREVLEKIRYCENSNDFVFDNEMIAQIFYAGYDIAEVTCPTKYFDDASSINVPRSIRYGFGVLLVTFQYVLQKLKLARYAKFKASI